MAEKVHGPIPKPVGFSYLWGDAAQELERLAPVARIVNLETSITTSQDYDPKGRNYRMHPANTPCLTAFKIDCCELANNHVLDWGPAGLTETRAVLHSAGMSTPLPVMTSPHRKSVVAGTCCYFRSTGMSPTDRR